MLTTEKDPAYSFSIPSVADDLALKCRVYHPFDLDEQVSRSYDKRRVIKGAIVAHPYAPLGGSYEDPVVLSVTETLLDQGFVVGTFNFRGAADSDGHTTWTGKAEQEDYSSFAGFMIYYLHSLELPQDPYRLETIQSVSDGNVQPTIQSRRPISLLLGGYSYGSLILARLPPVTAIIERFETAEKGTAAGEIILRAGTLAKQTTESMHASQSPASPRGRQLRPDDVATSPQRRVGASPITVGGEETDGASRRRSRDSRRSVDFVRKSIEAPQRIKALVTGAPSSSAKGNSTLDGAQVQLMTGKGSKGPIVIPKYLLVSPVLLPFSHMLCPPGPPSILPGLRRHSSADSHVGDLFHVNDTLVLFGSSDSFTASRRLRAWAEKNARESKSSFEWQGIDGAGHFWNEQGVMKALQKRITDWVATS